MKYRVLIEPDEDGMFIAHIPSLPGCVSEGKTRAEAISNVKEAAAAYIESLRMHDGPIPPSIWEDTVEIAPFDVSGTATRPFGLCKGLFVVPDDFDEPFLDDVSGLTASGADAALHT